MEASLSSISLLLFIQLFLSNAPLTCSFSFNFPSFTTNMQEIMTQGIASISDDGFIELIPISGDAFYKECRVSYWQPIPVWDSSGKTFNFSTHFSFTLSPLNSTTGEGMVFFLTSFPSTITATRSKGEYFGVFDASTVPDTVAVEFDTYENSNLDDISANHIGIDIGNAISTASIDLQFNMTNGYRSDAWINYDSSTNNLSVFFSYPELTKSWSMYSQVDLRKHLPQQVAVGFATAIGGWYYQRTTLLSWNFTSSFSPYFFSSASPPLVQAEVTSTTAGKKTKIIVISIIILVIIVICLLVLFVCFRSGCLRSKVDKYRKLSKPDTIKFTYNELVTVTKNFSEELGKGASGQVFKGTLTNSNTETKVAVKSIIGTQQIRRDYESELQILSGLSHINLVQFIGYCDENNHLLLVYEYMSNQSLDHHLYNKKTELKWSDRYKIATGLATALSYLHEQYTCIIHRDVRPNNVMLDSEFNAKLGDFRTARVLNHRDDVIQTTTATGEHGYYAPEYVNKGKTSRMSDIFSFGVVAIEIACGRKPREDDFDLVKKVRRGHEFRMDNEMLYENVKLAESQYDRNQMERLLTVGLSCCNTNPMRRMLMPKAVEILNSNCDLSGVIIDYDK